MSRGTILLGMSGGVDSTTAAWFLRNEGYDVVGVTLLTCPPGRGARECGIDAERAARLARAFGLEHRVLDVSEAFERRVVAPFVAAYRRGMTPNPCVGCNPSLKFPALFEEADRLGIGPVATGHYARVVRTGGSGTPCVARGRDASKDQSYFLSGLAADQLVRVRFPLGEKTKMDVRRVAASLGLPVSVLSESQEVCFAPDGRTDRFLRARLGDALRGGDIVDESGQVLGRHEGVEFFTIGQRRGLGIGGGRPYYVISVEPGTGRVVVGADADLYRRCCRVVNVRWTFPPGERPARAEVQIRRRHRAAPASIRPLDEDAVRVVFDDAQRAITPGQAAVFYVGDVVAGSGTIFNASGEEEKDA